MTYIEKKFGFQRNSVERSLKMETSCWFCKKWEEHYYWDHLKLTNHRFMKVMLKDFSEGMAIPNQFVENFKGELSETINLVVITGKLWQFSLQKISGLLCIRDGWKEFVDEHGIKEGEYLVFTCSGNSSFRVQIFDNGGQVSQSSMLARRFFEQETIVLHEVKKLKSEKRSIELQLTNAIQLESPYFIKLMKESAINYPFFMAIPCDFISKHFTDKPEKVTLQNPEGKKWYLICNCRGNSWGFRGETWENFVQENYLKIGDECFFELKTFTKKNSVMNVHIVRAIEADLP